MRILYGVQGTGNGHISRARMMARHFQRRGADVDFLFSGRAPQRYFDMEPFGDYQLRTGLTFVTERGSICYRRTLLENRPLRFVSEVRRLDVSGYDLILTDFEPTVAWAGRLAKKNVVGFGHQYAFAHAGVPMAGISPLDGVIMRHFAPVSLGLGLHWAPFGAPILPPIINPDVQRAAVAGSEAPVLVYLPFEDQAEVTAVLSQLPQRHFLQYAPDLDDAECGNVSLRRTCLEGFKRDQQRAGAVICNAGFELISECLHLGLPVLAKPVRGQGEQRANAVALTQLGLAKAFDTLDAPVIAGWLAAPLTPTPQGYPDVAAAVVDWLLDGRSESLQSLSTRLWQPLHCERAALADAAADCR